MGHIFTFGAPMYVGNFPCVFAPGQRRMVLLAKEESPLDGDTTVAALKKCKTL